MEKNELKLSREETIRVIELIEKGVIDTLRNRKEKGDYKDLDIIELRQLYDKFTNYLINL